jgi:hypothetical protein
VALVACAAVVVYSALSRSFRCGKKLARRFLRYNSTCFIARYLVDPRGRESWSWAGVRELGVVVYILAITAAVRRRVHHPVRLARPQAE